MKRRAAADQAKPWPALFADLATPCGECRADILTGEPVVSVGRWGGASFFCHQACRMQAQANARRLLTSPVGTDGEPLY